MLRPRRSIEGYTASGHALVAAALEARFGFVAINCPTASSSATAAHGNHDARGNVEPEPAPLNVRILYALGHKHVDAPTVLAALHAAPISTLHPVPVRRLQASCLLPTGVEVFFVFERLVDERPFSQAEARRLEAFQAALQPFAERVALGHGAGTGRALLTRREREAAAMLLGSRAQKCFSDELGTSDARAREVVRNVYTKLGVSSRAELCAAWLGGEGADDALTVHEVPLQRPRPTR
jgi:DNA-binding CsgD family transcriptional regulator